MIGVADVQQRRSTVCVGSPFVGCVRRKAVAVFSTHLGSEHSGHAVSCTVEEAPMDRDIEEIGLVFVCVLVALTFGAPAVLALFL